MEFLRPTNLLQAGIADGKLHIQDSKSIITLEFVDFGSSEEVMNNLGIRESAIKIDFDRVLFGKLKDMLGEMAAIPIDNYVVIYNPADQNNVLITKAT